MSLTITSKVPFFKYMFFISDFCKEPKAGKKKDAKLEKKKKKKEKKEKLLEKT